MLPDRSVGLRTWSQILGLGVADHFYFTPNRRPFGIDLARLISVGRSTPPDRAGAER
jgi:hypothetical protein